MGISWYANRIEDIKEDIQTLRRQSALPDHEELLRDLRWEELAEDPMRLQAFCGSLLATEGEWQDRELLQLFNILYDALRSPHRSSRKLLARTMGRLCAGRSLSAYRQWKKLRQPRPSILYVEQIQEVQGDFLKGYFSLRSAELEPWLIRAVEEESSSQFWLSMVREIPFELWPENKREEIVLRCIERLPSLEVLFFLEQIWPCISSSLLQAMKAKLQENSSPLADFAGKHLLWKAGLDEKPRSLEDEEAITLMLHNLKENIPTVVKQWSLAWLLYSVEAGEASAERVAFHLVQLLKNQSDADVMEVATSAMLKLTPKLREATLEEITQELLSTLENPSYRQIQVIPAVLAAVMGHLHPEKLLTLTREIHQRVKSSDEEIAIQLIESSFYYLRHQEEFLEVEAGFLLSLFTGMAHYDERIRLYAHYRLAELLGSDLREELRSDMLGMLLRKLLILLQEGEKACPLCRLIRRYLLQEVEKSVELQGVARILGEQLQRPVAFFPGSFDPFSLGHEEIAKQATRLGFDVYIAIDEFSWSKRTSPNKIRRRIMNLSIADELHLYEFPEDISVNIANPKDLTMLQELFRGRELWLLLGSDVILHASAYRSPKNPLIRRIPHLIFSRGEEESLGQQLDELLENYQFLRLPGYDHISSTRIRDSILDAREIDDMIDPLARRFIYERDLYQQRNLQKEAITLQRLRIEIKPLQSVEALGEFERLSGKNYRHLLKKSELRALVIYSLEDDSILGFSLFYWLKLRHLHFEENLRPFFEAIQADSVGRLFVLEEVYGQEEFNLFNETLAYCLKKDFSCCLHHSTRPKSYLKELGFRELQGEREYLYMLDMNHPATLHLDLEDLIKEPYRSDAELLACLEATRRSLRQKITSMDQGQMLLVVDQRMVYESLIKSICKENQVPTHPLTPRALGPYLCVPFGEILKKRMLPNTITKSMHTEKHFEKYEKKWSIEAYPGYLELEDQVTMIQSFDRDVLLVDDLLNKGYRLKRLMPLLKEASVPVRKMFVGVLSGRGKMIADSYELDIEYAYYVPRLSRWFQESKLYPFLGGDAVLGVRHEKLDPLIGSLNLILPYNRIPYMSHRNLQEQGSFSLTCLKNARALMLCLEKKYQDRTHNNLTLERLGDVLEQGRYPWPREGRSYDINCLISDLIHEDIQALRRLGIEETTGMDHQ